MVFENNSRGGLFGSMRANVESFYERQNNRLNRRKGLNWTRHYT